MQKCDFCGSILPDYASFCGQCGRVPYRTLETRTMASDFQMSDIQNYDTSTNASVSGNVQPESVYSQPSFMSNITTASLNQDEEEDEEKRRRAALLGMEVPLLGSPIVDGMPNAGDVPMVEGTPQIGGIPIVQGTPYPQAGSIEQALYSSPTVMAPQISTSVPVSPLPVTTVTLHHPQHPHPPHHHSTPQPKPHGCSLVFIIAAIMIPLLIILSFIGLGLTVFAPSLSLSGSTTVVQGGTFTLQGSHFIPESSVTLTIDGSIPLYFSSRSLPIHSAYTSNISSMQMLPLDTRLTQVLASANNIVSVGGDGTFTVTITVDPKWAIGEHTITATESPTHRSTSVGFTIYMAGTTPIPTTPGSASPTPSVITTPSPNTTLPSLSCINPSTLSLGPILQGFNQPVSAPITLCTSGTGTITWTATWDQNAAPWLHLDQTSGQISAPGQAQVSVSALASNLTPGSYSVMLAFTSQPGNSTKSVQITLTVQSGCASGNANALSYTGVANVSDPAAQAVTITNCGPTGTWSAAIQTNNGGNWLFASPTTGTLNSGATNNVTITASNLKAQLAAGTYSGNITFKIGSGAYTVHVTLTVMQAPTLSVTPTTIFANRQCSPDQTGGNWVCFVSLINNSNTLSLHWFATSSVSNIAISPSSDTLQSGQSNSVQFSIPQADCSSRGKGTLTFTGPANAVNVVWYCILG